MQPDVVIETETALFPRTEAELAEAIVSAKGPLRISGGGTRDVGPEIPGAVLRTSRMRGISLYEPGALTMVVAAGTPMDEVDEALAAENQRLAFEPMDFRRLLGTEGTPTIGGVAAANISGPRRIQAGACRDAMLGVRFVDGRGTVLKNGGRVMKNVTGYDLVKLMAGSRGTLGVISEISFKVLPRPETEATLVIPGLTCDAAVTALSRALGSPYEVTGAAHIATADPSRTLIRVEGFADAVTRRIGLLRELVGQGGEVVSDPARSSDIWREVRDVHAFAGGKDDIWRLSVRPSAAAGLLQLIGDPPAVLDWGGGLIWLAQPPGTDLRAKLGPFDGHATLIRASAQTRAALPVFHPEPAPLAALSSGLRRQFDPRGILNPGLMDG